jgi:ankyrin repeat protein
MAFVLPPFALAQQPSAPEAPGIIERITGGVRDVFKSIFGGARQAEPAKPPEQAPATPAAAAPPAKPADPPASAAEVPVQASPVAQTAGNASLPTAIARGDYAAAAKLIEQGVDLELRDDETGATALHFAVMKGRMELIEQIVRRRADVNSRTRNGTTPLHTAVVYARKEIAEYLLDNGADINARSTRGVSALEFARDAKNQPIADMLVGRGAK